MVRWDRVILNHWGSILKNLVLPPQVFNSALVITLTTHYENLPYEFEEGGAKMRRLYTYRFFVLVPGEILPYTLKLKSSSRNAGKELFTEMYVKNMMGKPQLPPAGRTFTLASKTEKNDDGTFAVSTIKMGDRTPHERVMEAFEWLKSVRSDNVVVVDDKDF